MSETEKDSGKQSETKTKSPSVPLIFISHDTRDGEIAEAFSKLLKSVSAGMLKTFRSSDKKGGEGIEFGDEWYKKIMEKLESASDVVCLFTEHSVNRPWILFEAGVAKGKLGTPVHGLALGIPLSKISSGPFYQFQNLESTKDELVKLVLQLSKKIPNLDPDQEVVQEQVEKFKEKVDKIIEDRNNGEEGEEYEDSTTTLGSSTAKLFEEMKVLLRELPMKIEHNVNGNFGSAPSRRFKRFHPMMLDEIEHILRKEKNAGPLGVLVVAGMFRDFIPWVYDLALHLYFSTKSDDGESILETVESFRRMLKSITRTPFFEEFAYSSKEDHMMLMELPRMLDHMLERYVRHLSPRHRHVVKRDSLESLDLIDIEDEL